MDERSFLLPAVELLFLMTTAVLDPRGATSDNPGGRGVSGGRLRPPDVHGLGFASGPWMGGQVLALPYPLPPPLGGFYGPLAGLHEVPLATSSGFAAVGPVGRLRGPQGRVPVGPVPRVCPGDCPDPAGVGAALPGGSHFSASTWLAGSRGEPVWC